MRLSHLEIAEFCRGLALLLHAGVSLSDGLYLLAEDAEQGPQQELFARMNQRMECGLPLSSAMAEEELLPSYVSGMVLVGERTGRLEESLHALANYYEARDRMEQHVRNAFTYPVVLMLLMLVVIVVLVVWVLPIFDEVYVSFGSHLTGVAGGLLQLGRLLKTAMPVLFVLVAVVAGSVFLFSVSDRFQQRALTFWRKKQGDKGVSRKMNDAWFAQALSMGLRSGLPIEEAVDLAGVLLEDVPAAAGRCRSCAEMLAENTTLSEALRQTELLPLPACRMLELGLRGGTGDQVMERIAERLSEEAEQALEQRVAQVEPTMVIIASVFVGVILLSVMLPLMNIMSAIG